MARPPYELSALEQHILLVAVRLHPHAYGVAICQDIEDRTGNRPSVASVYAALDRLDKRGHLRSVEGEATSERGGRKKTYYVVTNGGRAALDQSMTALNALSKDLIVGGAGWAR